MRLPFIKYHGLGNDFLVVDGRDGLALRGELGRWLCDRHQGVGGDGVLVWSGSVEAPRMEVVNADGSIAEMCGNGLRCFVKFLFDEHAPGATEVVVATGAGPLRCQAERGPDGRVTTVRAAMGRASLQPQDVPVADDRPWLDRPLEVDGVTVHLTAVGTGNPHAVTFDPLDDATRARLGPILSRHPLFPREANIEFVRPLGPAADGQPRMQVDVFERGCGWTRACGTGATAAAVAAVRLGRLSGDRPIAVRLPGGWLEIEVTDDGEAFMGGPAVEVFRGEVVLPSGPDAAGRAS